MILPPIGDSAALILGDKGVQGASICWAVPSFLEDNFCIRSPNRPTFNNYLSFCRGIFHFYLYSMSDCIGNQVLKLLANMVADFAGIWNGNQVQTFAD